MNRLARSKLGLFLRGIVLSTPLWILFEKIARLHTPGFWFAAVTTDLLYGPDPHPGRLNVFFPLWLTIDFVFCFLMVWGVYRLVKALGRKGSRQQR